MAIAEPNRLYFYDIWETKPTIRLLPFVQLYSCREGGRIVAFICIVAAVICIVAAVICIVAAVICIVALPNSECNQQK